MLSSLEGRSQTQGVRKNSKNLKEKRAKMPPKALDDDASTTSKYMEHPYLSPAMMRARKIQVAEKLRNPPSMVCAAAPRPRARRFCSTVAPRRTEA